MTVTRITETKSHAKSSFGIALLVLLLSIVTQPRAQCQNQHGLEAKVTTINDLRHHAITELAESQASDSRVMAIAGHVSPKMLQHYSHVRLQAKRSALDALSTRRADLPNLESKPEGYDTNHDTKPAEGVTECAQVFENMVELVGIEPTTSSLRTMRSPS